MCITLKRVHRVIVYNLCHYRGQAWKKQSLIPSFSSLLDPAGKSFYNVKY